MGIGMPGAFRDVNEQLRYVSLQNDSPLPIDGPDVTFEPRRVASWWCAVEDLLWPEKKVVDRIKRRAAAFAEAGIDTAVNFGFHIRFDFANYFGQLHGYYANVCEELHKHNVKFLEHYSCNHVERPRDNAEKFRLHKRHRHHTLLYPDPIAAAHAQYEGHLFQEICEKDVRDGTRGYAPQYQLEAFCHNNPGFLDMHKKYLQRLIREVPHDGYEVDDMCDYPGLTTCGCDFCRARFRKDYGHEIPSFEDKSFWGDTSRNMLYWGNYENSVFRDWLKMKDDSIADHVKMIKSVVGKKPLMTCCSSTGPITLNSISLNLERIAGHLDFFMLENVGLNVLGVNWTNKDAEALHQKDIAAKRGNAPAIALSYTVYKEGGYLGWSLARFWGVANWSSTLHQRLEEDPEDAPEMEDVIGPTNRWELKHSDLNHRDGKDVVEIRLVNNSYCRENGWRNAEGKSHWEKVVEWSEAFVKNNIGYRFVRKDELADADTLASEKTPLLIDNMGCVSDKQLQSIQRLLEQNRHVFLGMPFGTHDEKGFKRNIPLSEMLLKKKYKHLHLIRTDSVLDALKKMVAGQHFDPIIRQVAGDPRWALRLRKHGDNVHVIHFMNTAMRAIPHATLRDGGNSPILDRIESDITNNKVTYDIAADTVNFENLEVKSPELGDRTNSVKSERIGPSTIRLSFDLDAINVYAVAQPA